MTVAVMRRAVADFVVSILVTFTAGVNRIGQAVQRKSVRVDSVAPPLSPRAVGRVQPGGSSCGDRNGIGAGIASAGLRQADGD